MNKFVSNNILIKEYRKIKNEEEIMSSCVKKSILSRYFLFILNEAGFLWKNDYEKIFRYRDIKDFEELYRKIALAHHEVQNIIKENERLKAKITELENVPKIKNKRTMWKYVLDLESRGMSDEAIRNALTGDGFSGAQADALLYDGEGTTKDAVKKWGEKFKNGE